MMLDTFNKTHGDKMTNDMYRAASKKNALIHSLLKPYLKKFQEVCVAQTTNDINQCILELQANKMNLLALDKQKQKFCKQFIHEVSASTDELIVRISEHLVKRLEDSLRRQSLIDCETYTKKIADKISEKLPGCEVTSLNLEGNLWKQSTLNVSTDSGESYQFVTKTIINQTLFGHRFYQFPTRMSKDRNKLCEFGIRP